MTTLSLLGLIAAPACLPHIASAASPVKVLGVSTKERLASRPGWPTTAEGGLPGF
ncbi:MAG TPA: hypothetical protein VNQ50_02170 [Xanthobacteraceae bacterium]|nr:hypothetical protein [Xanthobacteraceae bacterium]